MTTTCEVLEPFTFRDGAVRLAWVSYVVVRDSRGWATGRRCVGVREIEAVS